MGHKVEAANCPTYSSKGDARNALIEDFDGECEVNHWARQPKSCSIFCNWAEDAGITMVSNSLWKQVSQNKLKHHYSYKGTKPSDFPEGQTRWREHANGFENFRDLPTQSLGDYLEVGAGMYTQLWNILEKRPDVLPSTITLVEPNIQKYLELAGCVYKTKEMHGIEVKLVDGTVETLVQEASSYDTVLVMNVIEHVVDASEFLTSVYQALRPGGVLIWGERYFEDPDESSTKVLGPATLHPIRLTRKYTDHFLSYFDPIYTSNYDTPENQARGFEEQGYFFMGKKKDVSPP